MSEFRNVDPPLWVAWHQALASIRVRFFRQALTSVGIALGIALFAGIQTMRLAQPPSGPEEASRLRWLVATSLVILNGLGVLEIPI